MLNLFDKLKDKAQRWTPNEVQAEILRQQIQELESPKSKDGNVTQTEAGFLKLKILKQRLADIKEPAELNAQGRDLMHRYWAMLEKMEESHDLPADADEIFEECCKWFDAMEDQRRRRHSHYLRAFKQTWPMVDWDRRRKMLHWLGRSSVRRFANEKPKFLLGRAALGGAQWAARVMKTLR